MITLKTYGPPGIYQDNSLIKWPYKKAEGLVYYLALCGTQSRQALISVFWPDMDQATAKKNLRNTLYVIKKNMGPWAIKAHGRDKVALEPEGVTCLDQGPSQDHMTFLEGFYIKEAPLFEGWVRSQRDKDVEESISSYYEHMIACEDSEDLIDICKKIMALDPYDESVYRKLMRTYSKMGHHNKAVEVYNKLKKTLKLELGIEPDASSLAMYRDLVEAKQQQESLNHPTDDVPCVVDENNLNTMMSKLSDSERHILLICSCYKGPIPFDDLAQVSRENAWNLGTYLKQLVAMGFIVEHERHDQIFIQFVSQPVKQGIYHALLKSQRRIIHKRIAQTLLDKMNHQVDMTVFVDLIYHFENGGDRLSELEWRVNYLSAYLHMHHETFPELKYPTTLHPSQFYVSNKEVDLALNRIDLLLDTLIVPSRLVGKVKTLKMELWLIKGRYAIKNGQFNEGQSWIIKLYDQAQKTGNQDMVGQSLLQLIYIKTNSHQLEGLGHLIDKGLQIDPDLATYKACVFLRLKGYYNLSQGAFEEASKDLQRAYHAIDALADHEKYTLGKLACQYYMAEVKRLQGDYREALALCSHAMGQLKA